MTVDGAAADIAPRFGLRTAVATMLLGGLALVPAISALIGEPYYVTLFTRIVIFALAAVGLNLILGYGAIVSFGHAMYIGIGAYAVGILSFYGDHQWLAAARRGARRRLRVSRW